jgi:hypothetical protein
MPRLADGSTNAVLSSGDRGTDDARVPFNKISI